MYRKSINGLFEGDEDNAYDSAYLISIASTKAS